MKFKEKDWCFCEFKLCKIVKMDGGRITEVSDGFELLCSADLSTKCYPLDIDILKISRKVHNWHTIFRALKNYDVSHGDLHRIKKI